MKNQLASSHCRSERSPVWCGALPIDRFAPMNMNHWVRFTRLFLALVSCVGALAQTSIAAILPPDTTSKQQAVYLATNNMAANTSGTNKMILLIVSDTNTCTACRSLEFGILPDEQVSNFLAESFVYWACGPEQNCKEYQEYTGTGTLPIPLSYVINPFSAQGVYQFYSSGADSAGTYFEWLSKSLLRATSPRVTAMTFTTPGTVVVYGASISTNVSLRKINYRLNSGAWASLTIPSGTWGSEFQLPELTLASGVENKLYLYGVDSSGTYKTKTNVVALVPGAVNPGGAVSVTPQATLVNLGSPVQLSSSLTNIPSPQSFQWTRGGTALAGATSSTLTIESATSASAGDYQLVILAGGNTYTSPAAHVWISAKPQITTVGNAQVNLSVEVFGPATTNAYFEAASAPNDASWAKVNSSAFTPGASSLGWITATENATGAARFYRPVVKLD
jgi:hypothetical protein